MKDLRLKYCLFRSAYSFTLLLLYASPSHSQSYSIEGRITDSRNKPVQYANVVLIGTSLGDASDENGLFEISNLTPGTYNLRFSAIGYVTHNLENIIIKDSSLVIDITMKEEVIESEAVVVTSGKYEQKKSELPVSAELINGEDFLE